MSLPPSLCASARTRHTQAFCTWNALETIEKCRASLGGHGYSAYSGLPSMYNDQAVQCTWVRSRIVTLRSALTAER